MSNNIKQPVPSEQNLYTATVRFFLEASRRYLAVLDTTGSALKHHPRSGGRGRYPSGAFALASTGRRHPSHPLQKQR